MLSVATQQAAPRHDAALNPIPGIPLAPSSRDPALHALRRSEQRDIQMEMAQMRAERVFLNSRSAELDAHKSRIEMLYRTMCRENSTAFSTPHAPQDLQAPHTPLAPQVSEAMQAVPSLVLHVMDIVQNLSNPKPEHHTTGGSCRRDARRGGGVRRGWAEQDADESGGPETNRLSSPPEYRGQLS